MTFYAQVCGATGIPCSRMLSRLGHMSLKSRADVSDSLIFEKGNSSVLEFFRYVINMDN